MAYNYKPFFSKISIQGKNQDELSYVFSNGKIEQKMCSAYLFGVFAISSAQEVYQQFIKQTVKHFIDFYNRTPEMERDEDAERDIDQAEFLFENAIQYVYDKVTSALIEFQEERKRSSPLDIKKIHCILGCLSNDTLYLSSTGSVLRGYYIFPSMNKQGFSRHSIAAIVDQQPYEDQSQRLFSHIISGNVGLPGGTACIATLSLLDYLSLEQLKQIITTQQPESIAPSLEKILGKASARNDMSALFIHPTYTGNAHSDYTHIKMQTAANTSMEELNSRQRGTDTVMSSARSIRIRNILIPIHTLFRSILDLVRRLEKWLFQPATWKRIISLLTKCIASADAFRHACLRTLQFIQKIILQRNFRELKRHIVSTSTSFISHKGNQLYVTLKRTFAKLRTMFIRLPFHSRFLLVLSILFITLFIYSLAVRSNYKKSQEQASAANAIIQSLQQKYSDTEASLIFKNDSGANNQLDEIRQLIASVPPTLTDDQKKKIQIIQNGLTAIEQKLSHIITIKDPAVIATLDALLPDMSINFSDQGTSLLISSNATLYLMQKNASIPQNIHIPSSISSLRTAALLSPAVLYLVDASDSHVIAINDRSVLLPASLPLAQTETRIDRLLAYNGNAYAYDSTSGAIFKHTKQSNSFSIGMRWIKDTSIDLHNVLDIDIDGTIYILKSGNQLFAYNNGKPRSIVLPSIRPAFTALTKIDTDAASPFLFLLETQGKRIIVIDKRSNAFIAQITSPVFQNIRDMHVFMKNLLILDGTTLYSIPLNSIK